MKSKIILLISLLIIVGLITSLLIFGVNRYRSMVVKPNTPTPVGPTVTPDPDKPFSILLLGYGGGNHDGGTLTDSIILAQVKPKEKIINLVSVPRDLWVELPVGTTTPFFSKINAAYSIGGDDKIYPDRPREFTGDAGGGQMAKKVIADVTGITPDYFVSVDFSGFTKAIDLLGGVDINVQKSFTDPLYPLEDKKEDNCGLTPEEIQVLSTTLTGIKLEEKFPCRYETLEFKKGITHMDGATALKYVRSRHSLTDGGDFNRAARQRQLLLAVRDKVINLNFFSKAIPLLNTLTSHIRTDIDLPQLEKFINRGLEYSNYEIKSIPLTGDNVLIDGWSADKQAILMPKEGIGKYTAIHNFVSPPSPTPTVKK